MSSAPCAGQLLSVVLKNHDKWGSSDAHWRLMSSVLAEAQAQRFQGSAALESSPRYTAASAHSIFVNLAPFICHVCKPTAPLLTYIYLQH